MANLRSLFRRMVTEPGLRRNMIHGYMALTILAAVLFFVGGGGWMDLIHVVGNHTVLYPLFGAMLAADAQLPLVMVSCGVFWLVYMLALPAAYLLAVVRRKYLPLAIVSFADLVFTVLVMTASICAGDLNSLHFLMLIGIGFSFGCSVYFLKIYDFCKLVTE